MSSFFDCILDIIPNVLVILEENEVIFMFFFYCFVFLKDLYLVKEACYVILNISFARFDYIYDMMSWNMLFLFIRYIFIFFRIDPLIKILDYYNNFELIKIILKIVINIIKAGFLFIYFFY
jgi:hypothetical protein